MKKVLTIILFFVINFMGPYSYSEPIRSGDFVLGLEHSDFLRRHEKNIRDKAFHQGTVLYTMEKIQKFWGVVRTVVGLKKIEEYGVYVVFSVTYEIDPINKKITNSIHKNIIDIFNAKYGKSKVSGNYKGIYAWDNERVFILKESNKIICRAKEKYLQEVQNLKIKNNLADILE